MYDNGFIKTDSIASDINKQFDMNSFLINKPTITNTTEIVNDINFRCFLLFLETIGLFSVSDGEKRVINIINKIPIISLISYLIIILLHIIGQNIKTIIDDTRQAKLVFAWSPYEKDLIILKNNNKQIISLKMFKNVHKIDITINFVIVKYNPSRPYFNISIFSSS